ncbi:hypothetical protein [Methylophaga sp.]|uniref:hypothetical protein n=1 Tax=Methylophaga sp. TaxID=2024840 RepID=UPI003A95DEE1
MIHNTEVLKQLYTLSQAEQTGTFFITTIQNRACHILLEQGRVVALSHGPHRGEQVLKHWSEMEVERYSFKPNVKMPLAGRSFLDDDTNIFRFLNVSFESDHDDVSHPVSASKKRIYRGVEIEENGRTAASQTPSLKVKKPLRIYRGQVIDD